MVVHYSGVERDDPAEAIARYQVTKGEGDPFPEIAYHFVVRWDGAVEQCHDLATRSWHAGAAGNGPGIAVCLPMLAGPKEAQLAATAALVAALEARLGRTLAVAGHRDLMATACPGPGWPEWRARLRPAAAGTREVVIDGVPVRWGFYDLYRKLEGLRPGLAGKPLGRHQVDPASGAATQAFSACLMAWRDGRMWVSFK